MGQGAFQGVPRVLSGVNKLLQLMDWQAGAGQEFDGVMGNVQTKKWDDELVEGVVRLGAVGPEVRSKQANTASTAGQAVTDTPLPPPTVCAQFVERDDDVIIILAPQSMTGASIYESLAGMCDKAEAQGTAVILINDILQDRPSSGGVMVRMHTHTRTHHHPTSHLHHPSPPLSLPTQSVRGRSNRMEFANSFSEIYHFRLLYSGTTFQYPILGAVRMARPIASEGGSPTTLNNYALFQRCESGGTERYVPVGSFGGREPTKEEITQLVPRAVQPIELTASPGTEGPGFVRVVDTMAPQIESKAAPASATDKFAPPSW